jgi:DNA-3-methyladenine glycosylase
VEAKVSANRLRAELVPLPRSFYQPSAETVARELLGHWLIRNTPDELCGGAIVETEAYITGDAACHAFGGETKRNRVMWGPPGYCYVYFIYGNHWCVNVVCRPAGVAEAVLIRAVEPIFGIEAMRARRPVAKPHELTNGPGKLCAAMDIGRGLNGVDLCDANSPLFFARNRAIKTFRQGRGPITTTARIGITRAASLPLRFYLAGSDYVSRRGGAREIGEDRDSLIPPSI